MCSKKHTKSFTIYYIKYYLLVIYYVKVQNFVKLGSEKKKTSVSFRQETNELAHSSERHVSLGLWSVPSNFEVIKLETLLHSSLDGRIFYLFVNDVMRFYDYLLGSHSFNVQCCIQFESVQQNLFTSVK